MGQWVEIKFCVELHSKRRAHIMCCCPSYSRSDGMQADGIHKLLLIVFGAAVGFLQSCV